MHSNFYRTFFKQTVKTLISSAASDLDMHCLSMSHKKDARLIKVNKTNSFPILEMLGSSCIYQFEFHTFCKQTVKTLILRHLGLMFFVCIYPIYNAGVYGSIKL